MERLTETIKNIWRKANEKLKRQPPLSIACYTLVAVALIYKFHQIFGRRWNENNRARLARLALYLPPVRAEYKKMVMKITVDEKKKTVEKWKKFGDPIVKLPENGWTLEALKALIDRYTEITNPPLAHNFYSGTIYSYSLREEADEKKLAESVEGRQEPRALSTLEEYHALSKILQEAYTHGFRHSYLWNSLHGNEFCIGDFITYQVVRITADMFGGAKDDVQGFITTGGTESLMLAMRCYRNWGVENKGHQPGDAVIICPTSIHAAVPKAGMAYGMEVVLTPTDEYGNLDLKEMEATIQRYGSRVVVVVASAPAYPLGVIDPIREIATMTKRYGIGMHVDCCLGGFIINNLKQHDTKYLSIPGVTSLSMDTHKNGWAPKGSSVLITRPIPDKIYGQINLTFYSIYAIPAWTGGVYGTPKDAGSQQVTNGLHALIALLAIGKNGYYQLAMGVHRTAVELAKVIRDVPQLELLGEPQVNVVAWRARRGVWSKGAIYALAHEMGKRGFIVNALSHEKLHFCVTGRSAGDPDAVSKFAKVLHEAIADVNSLDQQVRDGKIQFPGSAGLYGMLEAALNPSRMKLNRDEYFQNLVLGPKGTVDSIKGYYMGVFDPYS